MRRKNIGGSVTVGIVVFNTPINTLKKTIEALKKSTVHIEINVLCNSSNIEYKESIADFCEEYLLPMPVYQENRGFGAGHNSLWKSCRSEWYVCCNPDVCVAPNAIQKLLEASVSVPNLALMMPRVLNSDGTIQPLARQHPTPITWLYRQLWRLFPTLLRPYEIQFDYSRSQTVEFVSGCFFMVKTDLMRKLEGFDESFFLYAEDADISRRAEKYGQNWYVADAEVTHEWAAEWRTSFRAFYRNMCGLLRYWLKYVCA